jgi:hypothetical protein
VAPLEWSNALAHVLPQHAGKPEPVACDFTEGKPCWFDQKWWDYDDPPKPDHMPPKPVLLKVRPFFETGTVVISKTLAHAGELTQGLCSPWQNDYRECSCYYWASARPDFVNVDPSPTGMSAGDNWLQKARTGDYVPDDYVDSRLILYDDLFRTAPGPDGREFSDWEKWLRFQIRGRDLPATPEDK